MRCPVAILQANRLYLVKANRMSFKRIASILIILLGYIAAAGAMQSLIKHLTLRASEQQYAEVRVGADNHLQILICKNWILRAEDMDQGSNEDEVVQDIYYWINLKGAYATTIFTNPEVHANGPVRHHAYQGTVTWEHGRNQVSINLCRTPSDPAKSEVMPFPANGTYPVRKVANVPFIPDGQ
jgi:hypothetical protein